MPPMNEGQELLHDAIEDNSAADCCLYDRRETGLFAKHAVLEAQRVPCPSLQARNELLLKPDRLVDSTVVALLRERRIFYRQRQHVLEPIDLLERQHDRLERQETCVDQVADLQTSGERLLHNRHTRRKMPSPKIDMIAVQVKQCAAQPGIF